MVRGTDRKSSGGTPPPHWRADIVRWRSWRYEQRRRQRLLTRRLRVLTARCSASMARCLGPGGRCRWQVVPMAPQALQRL
eukprot:7379547-Prymnesium_polylepis.1